MLRYADADKFGGAVSSAARGFGEVEAPLREAEPVVLFLEDANGAKCCSAVGRPDPLFCNGDAKDVDGKRVETVVTAAKETCCRKADEIVDWEIERGVELA